MLNNSNITKVFVTLKIIIKIIKPFFVFCFPDEILFLSLMKFVIRIDAKISARRILVIARRTSLMAVN